MSALNRDSNGLALRSDPSALAPERMLVFEVRGSIQNFIIAVRNVTGLELIDEEEIAGDDRDKSPAIYLLVPDATALKNIGSLWQRWINGEELGTGLTAWRDVFATLRDIRPWGPQDRVQDEERNIFAEEIDGRAADDRIRLEIELVFRANEARSIDTEAELTSQVVGKGGRIVSRCRIPDIGYHAVLAEIPVAQVRSIIDRTQTSIAGLDFVMHICPQSLAASIEIAEPETILPQYAATAVTRSPILSLLDGVPVAQHRLLAGTLIVDDQFSLEPLAPVNERVHGTAMASLIMHGDLNRQEVQLDRKIHCVPVLGAGGGFPEDRLIVDIIYLAILAMREGSDGAPATAPEVLIVNLSLGNARKPFHGRLSAWARLLDRLSYRFGILFLVSAGNHATAFGVPAFTNSREFEESENGPRSENILQAVGNLIAERRLLAPAETVNGITIGAANIDNVLEGDRLSASLNIDPYPGMIISNPSSALGPGFAKSVKPDVLMPGGREHLFPISSGGGLSVRPSGAARAHGLKVAHPRADDVGYTGGTSVATALASRACHRIHDALEAAYGEAFTSLDHAQRAVLLKALLIHSAAWPSDAANLVKQVLGPADGRLHSQQKDNIRRFLGYGLADPDLAIACVDDRATFWATGMIPREHKVAIDVPVPICINSVAQQHALVATLAWFTPTLPGRQTYRAVRLKLEEPEKVELHQLQVSGAKEQPDQNQGRRGTVFSRRWEGERAPNINANHIIQLVVQREPDLGQQIDEQIPFGLAITLTMPGINQIYEQVRERLRIGLPINV